MVMAERARAATQRSRCMVTAEQSPAGLPTGGGTPSAVDAVGVNVMWDRPAYRGTTGGTLRTSLPFSVSAAYGNVWFDAAAP